MKLNRIALALLVAAAPTVAQISSGPGVCFAFNTTPTSASSLPLVPGGELYLGFQATATATIERIDLSVSFGSSAGVSAEVYQSSGIALGALLGFTTTPTAASTQASLLFNPPISFTNGSTYALRLFNSTGTMMLSGDLAMPHPIQYLLSCGAAPALMWPPCESYPTSGTHGTTLSFRSVTCGQTPYASATPRGVGCGGSPSGLGANAPPILGAPFTFYISGFFQTGTCHIFWAFGPATPGVDLGIGSGCTNYLDLLSLQALSAGGFEPLLTQPINGMFNGASINLPLNPALAGVTVTAQAVLYLSTTTGIPTPFGNFALTNALELTLGY